MKRWSILSTADKLKGDPKLEEDIAPPFRCRFSHSTTITVAGDRKTTLQKTPKTLGEATAFFPVLSTLRADGRSCDPETTLEAVNSITVYESIWKGGKIIFEPNDEEKSENATVALILWTRGKAGRPAVAELSFRIKDSEEHFSRDLAEAARSVYNLLQRLGCSRSEGMTKTENIYRDASRD
jgi:hypothetical protein